MIKRTFFSTARLVVATVAMALCIGVVAQPAFAENEKVGSITDATNDAKGTGQPDTLFGSGGVFMTITNTLLYIIGAISVIMLVIGGIRYTISGGDEKQVTTAKNTILYAIIGIIVALLAYAIVNFVIVNLTAAN